MNAEFQHLMDVGEDKVDEEIVELVLTNLFRSHKSGWRSVTAVFWNGRGDKDLRSMIEVYDKNKRRPYEDFFEALGRLSVSFETIADIFEICERNSRNQQRLSVSVLSVELPALEITIKDPDRSMGNPAYIVRIMIQGIENISSFLEKFSYRLHVQEA